MDKTKLKSKSEPILCIFVRFTALKFLILSFLQLLFQKIFNIQFSLEILIQSKEYVCKLYGWKFLEIVYHHFGL